MQIEQLRVLVEIQRRGSFSAAAEELSYTQPAVSRHVAALESELGVALVDRSLRPVRLTEAGNALVARAEAVLSELARARGDLEAIAGLQAGRICVGSYVAAAPTIAAPAIAELARRHPDLEVELSEGDRDELIHMVRSGELDLALVYEFGDLRTAGHDGLEQEPLLDEPYLLIAPANHRLASRKRVALRELAGEAWIFPSSRTGQAGLYWRFMTRACADAGFDPRIVFQITDCQTVQALVAAGMGIAVLPQLTLHPINPGVRTLPVGPDAPSRRVIAMWRGRAPRPSAMNELLKLLRSAARSAGGSVQNPGR